ncbi:F-box/LRR-repeat protein At5g63520-like isoform X1 [Pyrus x bretschneideri]|uniref:F-box/LRR-repeat protein At5g63520-like isoform X1 n=1 Tax=Pyrus x bretschneideri TaxID=225117 RepID=UPI00202F6CB2|nr:F-box/LRR-repeat protein At5g63520-like isoform X1 [Pyrus x bretschneideri]
MDGASSSAAAAIKTDTKRPQTAATGLFSPINDDLLHKILSRLPALSFASAACVSKSWNQICSRILTRPKLASALSLHPSPKVAVKEVIEKVLAEPIRPHFVVANIGSGFGLYDISKLISKKLGSSVPFIISTSSGIFGRDALTHEFKEVKWGEVCGDGSDEDCSIPAKDANYGILLTVGFVPGLKVDAIPLLRTIKDPREVLLDKFIMDIKDYTASVSDCTSPVGIMMFGDGLRDMKPIVDALDYAMPAETVIVGDERGRFLYRSENESRNVCGSAKYFTDAVTLVFAKDKDKPHGKYLVYSFIQHRFSLVSSIGFYSISYLHAFRSVRYKVKKEIKGIGDIQFQIALSNGVSTVGSRHKAVSVKVNDCERSTWLTARREGHPEILDGQQILDDINDELANHVDSSDLYIGVTKRRKISIGSEKPRWITSLEYHGVVGGDDQYLYVSGVGIKTGDYFNFYRSDPETALASCSCISSSLKKLKVNQTQKHHCHMSEVFGGFMFACCGRGEPFFGRANVDGSPFVENFSTVPLAGIFCGGEIARGSLRLTGESQKDSDARCTLHVYCTIYLVLSYTPAPAPLEH